MDSRHAAFSFLFFWLGATLALFSNGTVNILKSPLDTQCAVYNRYRADFKEFLLDKSAVVSQVHPDTYI